MNHYLLTPGPVASSEKVLRAQSKQLIGHRGSKFAELFKSIEDKLKLLLKTNQEIVILPSSGTGALECLAVNFISPSTHVLSVSCGVFGNRFREIAARCGGQIVSVDVPMGNAVTPALVAQSVEDHPECSILLLTQNETSTAVCNPIKDIIAAIPLDKRPLIFVDGVSSIGGMPCYPQEWGVDGLAFASQKGLLTPPGLGMVWLSQKARAILEKLACPSYYFDLKLHYKELEKEAPFNPYTPPVSLFYALDVALTEISEFGVDNWFCSRKQFASAFAAGLEAMGYELLVKDSEVRSSGVTAICLPGCSIKDINAKLTGMGIQVAGGQGKLKGEILRIAHYNDIGWPELCLILGALYASMGEKQSEAGNFIEAAWNVWGKE